MAGRRDLRRKMAAMLELPEEMMLDVARISLVGDMDLVVENHRGLVAYSPDQVILDVPQGRIAVAGTDLRIGFLSPDQVTILGRIRTVRYVEPEGGSAGC